MQINLSDEMVNTLIDACAAARDEYDARVLLMKRSSARTKRDTQKLAHLEAKRDDAQAALDMLIANR